MSRFKHTTPTKPSFAQEGPKGYTFPTETNGIEIGLENVTRGHDNYATEMKTTTIYYVVDGGGDFPCSRRGICCYGWRFGGNPTCDRIRLCRKNAVNSDSLTGLSEGIQCCGSTK